MPSNPFAPPSTRRAAKRASASIQTGRRCLQRAPCPPVIGPIRRAAADPHAGMSRHRLICCSMTGTRDRRRRAFPQCVSHRISRTMSLPLPRVRSRRARRSNAAARRVRARASGYRRCGIDALGMSHVRLPWRGAQGTPRYLRADLRPGYASGSPARRLRLAASFPMGRLSASMGCRADTAVSIGGQSPAGDDSRETDAARGWTVPRAPHRGRDVRTGAACRWWPRSAYSSTMPRAR